MRIAIVGSRKYPDLVAVHDFVATLPAGTVIVSGGALGVDTAAVHAAKSLGFAYDVMPADWSAHGKSAGMIRNREMIRTVDEVVAFWDGASRGTADAIRVARQLGKPVKVFHDEVVDA